MQERKRVVSGIRPTGELHLGNYLGAIRDFIPLQEHHQCFFFAADLHALTTISGNGLELEQQSIEVLRLYLACGIDPDKSVLYRQSDIAEIPYIALLLGMVAPVGELNRCTTYKEKVKEIEARRVAQDYISLGLLAYPVLMAADVLFCNADLVPVGEDQIQHLEIAREVARRYNTHLSSAHRFTEPQPYRTGAVRIPGLRAQGKMSKSVGGPDDAIMLLDSDKEIKRKVMAAVTDSGTEESGQMSQPLSNLFTLMELCCKPETVSDFRERYQNGDRKFYGAMKKALADAVIELLEPIKERYHSPECSQDRVRQMLFENSERVRTLARQTLFAMRQDFGLHSD
ncbi:MAG: tryptophan--tRNA ligase [Gammaproteobacteria bacterium]